MEKVAQLLRSFNAEPRDIAARTGLSEKRVAEILSGEEVSLSELRALARGLRVPLHSFATGVRPADRNATMRLLFRRGAGGSDAFDPIQEFVANFVDAALEILPEAPSLPDWLEQFSVKDETYQAAEGLAYEFRERFFSDRIDEPIPDLAKVLSCDAGIVIGLLKLSRYEGVSLIANNYPFIFISPRFPPRMLFTLAHELGHIVAHHVSNETALFESAGEVTRTRGRSKSEAFVDVFASVLLMPAGGVGTVLRLIREALNIKSKEIGDIEILYLARIFGVSFEVAARRCENLDLLPEGGAASLVREIKKHHGSPEKRASEAGLPERESLSVPALSENVMRVLVRQIEEGSVSAGWAADKFGLSINDIYAAHAAWNREYNH